MGRIKRPNIIENSLHGRQVTFLDKTVWRLTQKICEKPWDGFEPSDRQEYDDWDPSEAHAVYECVQIRGPQRGSIAIVKVRIEVPYRLPPDPSPEERAKDASGMRLNSHTQNEINLLEKLTKAGCPATPKLLAVKIDAQDPSVLAFPEHGLRYWMPGGYIVYILMAKLPAQPLELNSFWREYSKSERDDVRKAFKKSYLELAKLGILHGDCKIENLMWSRKNQQCYIIDLEQATYNPAFADPVIWTDGEFSMWNLMRSYAEPHW